jgi:hypothetical protein
MQEKNEERKDYQHQQKISANQNYLLWYRRQTGREGKSFVFNDLPPICERIHQTPAKCSFPRVSAPWRLRGESGEPGSQPNPGSRWRASYRISRNARRKNKMNENTLRTFKKCGIKLVANSQCGDTQYICWNTNCDNCNVRTREYDTMQEESRVYKSED